ncbi:MAG: DNA mismatch repair endonuclease MutL [Chlorobiota bacterium]|nr:MAG: DNA mismatch repair endonuclease MutL [Chlorobiota bacterium]
MSFIHKLPDSLANKIAAGEVVQRPESAIKELVENAIDAGATEISIVVKNAGKTLMFVRDNGSGMNEEDAKLCFQRHATSKIFTSEDLDRIITLGFRGEALAAIASVAQIELKTRIEGEDLGTIVKIDNGEIIEVDKISCEKGTTISVKNLFFSVPARRKFLKANSTEFKHVAEVIQKFALCYPNVTFTFSDDDTLILNLQSKSLDDRINDLYGVDFIKGLIPYQTSGEGITVTGYIGKPNFSKRTKADQYFFLNGRYISSKNLSHAVFTGYEHLLDAQSYPPYILFIQIDPEKVDVNVHPTKSEVKFDDETYIYKLLQEGTRLALKSLNLTPTLNINFNETGEGVLAALKYSLPAFENNSNDTAFKQINEFQNDELNLKEGKSFSGGSELVRKMFDELQNNNVLQNSTNTNKKLKDDLLISSPERIFFQESSRSDNEADRGWILQLHNKYILTQIRSGLMIIDQHVAHERILYEKALKMMNSAIPMSQQLLFPIELTLTPVEQALVRELRKYLLGLGFEFNLSDSGKIKIIGVPNDVRPGLETTIFREIIQQYIEYEQLGESDSKDMIAASFGCKGAIKAGDKLTEKEQRTLIDELFATSMPYVCPHGRPIVTKIELSELDRRFGRTS